METPGVYKITMYQGATFDQQFVWKIDNVAVDLSNYSARMQVRESYSSATTIISLTSGDGITLGNAGEIDLLIPADDSADIPSGTYVYDLELESDSGEVSRVLQGTFIVSPEVTR